MEVKETISEVIAKIELKRFGYLCRRNDTRIPEILYEWERERRRCREQPMFCKPSIHQIIRNLDIRTEDAQDRDRWRTIISGRKN